MSFNPGDKVIAVFKDGEGHESDQTCFVDSVVSDGIYTVLFDHLKLIMRFAEGELRANP